MGSVRTTYLVAALLAGPAAADQVSIPPNLDTALFENNFSNSSGAGRLFAGETRINGSRRALLRFDVAAAVPAGSTITSVVLQIDVSQSGPSADASNVFNLHRVLAEWGEGSSNASFGQGAPAQAGDATWNRRVFPDVPWAILGGDFVAAASGSAPLPTQGVGQWPSQLGTVADVQMWLDNAAGNAGWILVGNETLSATARHISSRESVAPPMLIVDFNAPASSPPAVPDGRSGSPLLIDRQDSTGQLLELDWDASLCPGIGNHHLIYGVDLPVIQGGLYTPVGGICDIGTSSPFTWDAVPDPLTIDTERRLLWFLMLADDDLEVEGSWGVDSSNEERNGPGPNGASSVCGIDDKDVSSSCGLGRRAHPSGGYGRLD